MALTTALGALLGYKANTTAARTSTNNNVTTPTYTPAQTAVQSSLGESLSRGAANPAGTPEFASGADVINRSYEGAGDSVTQQLAARGFGKSGELGAGLQKIGLSRAGAMGNLYSSLHSSFMDAAQRFGFANPGHTSDTTSVAAGDAGAGALSGGLTAFLTQLNQAAAMGGGG